MCRNDTDCDWLHKELKVALFTYKKTNTFEKKQVFFCHSCDIDIDMQTLLLCRIFVHFQCNRYELDFTPDNAWFNGDYTSIIGQCECPDEMDWDDWEMTCYVREAPF